MEAVDLGPRRATGPGPGGPVDFGDRCVRCARVVRLPPASSGLDTDGRRGRAAALPSSRTRSRRVRGRGWPPHDSWCGGPTYGTQWCAWQMYSTTVPGATLLGHEGTADDTRMRSSRYRDYCSSPRHSPKFEVRTAKRTRARRRRLPTSTLARGGRPALPRRSAWTKVRSSTTRPARPWPV